MQHGEVVGALQVDGGGEEARREVELAQRRRDEDGEVVGLGTHNSLLATCPTYVEIVESQLRAEVAS